VQLYRCEQVRAADRAAIASGVPGAVLMKRAGRAAFDSLHQRWPQCRSVLVLCGGGNNGGDGLVVAALALASGWDVQVVLARDLSALRGDAALAARYAEQEGANFVSGEDFISSAHTCETGTVIVDALLGTGFKGAPRGIEGQLIEWINHQSAAVLALDLPSGLDGDSGSVTGLAVEADATMTFVGAKAGLFSGAGPRCCGDIELADLGIAAFVEQQQAVARLSDASVLPTLAARKLDQHKGHFGFVAVVGGDLGSGGAALLAAEAALACGSGLCALFTRSEHVAAALARVPEVMTRGVAENADLLPQLQRATTLVLGPGLGRGEWSRLLAREALKLAVPTVIDADALNLLADGELQLPANPNFVLTPHPGEAARLLACSVADVQADRFAAVRTLSEKYSAVAVLKGSGTLIAANGACWVNGSGNAAMASGGMGDVLAGLIGALLAQGMSPSDAAVLGVYLHGHAADLALSEHNRVSLRAGDLIPILQRTLPAHVE